MKQNKSIFIIIGILIVAAIGAVAFVKFSGEDSWICQDGQWVKHGNPDAPEPTEGCAVANDETVKTSENIKVSYPKPNNILKNSSEISGRAKLWYFEGSFPYQLLDEKGEVMTSGAVEAQGDWMTEKFVPFKAKINFVSDKDQNGTLVLTASDPSGMGTPEKIEIQVRLQKTEATEISDTKDYTFSIGRTDPDIQSVRTYAFTLPEYMGYELLGEDAQSGYMHFKIGNKLVFYIQSFDYAQGKELFEDRDNFYAFSTVGDHTNILYLIDKDSTKELELFMQTFTIEGEKVF